ncbi:MAG: transposase [bacterium]|nr:transposase [bacterium]
MLRRREGPHDWISILVYQLLPLPSELQRLKELFPEEQLVPVASQFYDGEMGRPSEDPIMLLKLMFLSFYFNVQGDKNVLHTLKYRIDWRQFVGFRCSRRYQIGHHVSNFAVGSAQPLLTRSLRKL